MTDPLNDLLRDVLVDEADRHDPRPDWDDVRRRAGQMPDHGARRWLLAAAAVVVAVVGTVVASRATEPDDHEVRSADRGDTTDPSFEVGPAAAPVDLPAGAPLADDLLVAVVAPGETRPAELAVIDERANVVRTLDPQLRGWAGRDSDMTLTPDRRTVLYTVLDNDCDWTLMAASTDGDSAPVAVRSGVRSADLSLDRTTLAYVTADGCDATFTVELAPAAGGPTERFVTDVRAAFAPTDVVITGRRSVTASWPATVEEPPNLLGKGRYGDGAHPVPASAGVVGVPWTWTLDFGQRVSTQVATASQTSLGIGGLDRAPDGRLTGIAYCCSTGDGTASLVTIEDGTTIDDGVDVSVLLGDADPSLHSFLSAAGYGPDDHVWATYGLASSHLVIDGVERLVPAPWPQRPLILDADW